ncbi:MAG TPA: ATP-binding cassette domain-containing protein, partial [Bacteroidales bacterium]|nr:ATP-binding cassette domain-containing protein [Bacteroidales bacterium]HRZ77409.1 ATP-binding cassette domain-containing protein [Bacteroidales bacterium]
MRIVLEDVGRKFNREWIFRGLSYTFEPGKGYAILGSNGSGKSTLLQVINGNLQATHGKIEYQVGEGLLTQDKVYRHISLGTPYQELIWDFSLQESLEFHARFKPYLGGMGPADILRVTGLERHRHKALRYFSSGMKQRVRLALAILSDTRVILLDEPSMNLDAEGRRWYDELLEAYAPGRLLIVCSNHQEEEYRRCGEVIDIRDYKISDF